MEQGSKHHKEATDSCAFLPTKTIGNIRGEKENEKAAKAWDSAEDA